MDYQIFVLSIGTIDGTDYQIHLPLIAPIDCTDCRGVERINSSHITYKWQNQGNQASTITSLESSLTLNLLSRRSNQYPFSVLPS